jgi:Alw26I/Eco31I/Esp3I family type II restriction endonuclease
MASQRENYETIIKNHPNYSFIPEELRNNWVMVSKNSSNPRAPFWNDMLAKLIENGTIPNQSTLVNLARYIHPTKIHVCKSCHRGASIYYVYPSQNTVKWLENTFSDCFKFEKDSLLTIFDIYQQINKEHKNELFTSYFGMNIDQLEGKCKNDDYAGKKLSPGVMGNPPDRLDGFHCYNSICCRKTKDKGRSDENMKSYARDRRAYEYLSDGKILLANAVMGKLNTMKHSCFICGKNDQLMSADHIGPISLGYVHDPNNFQACCSTCNSSKNNRITNEDIKKIKILEETGINMLSWWANNTWNKYKNMDISVLYKRLSENAKKFMSIFEWLKVNKQHIIQEFINEIYMNHDKSYVIDNIDILSTGDIKFTHTEKITPHKKTKQTQKERTIQILLEKDSKINRKIKISLSDTDINDLSDIDIYTFKNKICKVLGDL